MTATLTKPKKTKIEKPETKDELVSSVIEALENGTAPWRKTWNTDFGTPRNGLTKKAYNGWNVFQLLLAQLKANYATGEWGTYKQWQSLGYSVKKGEKSLARVGFYGTKTKDEENDEEKKSYFFWKSTPVFNFAQTTPADPANVPTPAPRPEPVEIDLLARARELGVQVKFGFSPVHYIKDGINTIEIPALENFDSFGSWFETMAHEMAHATESLLGWERTHTTANYAEGELRAELAALFLCLEMGVQPKFGNSISYLEHWAKMLKADPKSLMRICADAQKAVNLIRGVLPENATETTEQE